MSKSFVPMCTESDVTSGRFVPLAAPVGVRPSGCGIEVIGAANPWTMFVGTKLTTLALLWMKSSAGNVVSMFVCKVSNIFTKSAN
jgi:hypothetical protein